MSRVDLIPEFCEFHPEDVEDVVESRSTGFVRVFEEGEPSVLYGPITKRYLYIGLNGKAWQADARGGPWKEVPPCSTRS